MVSTELALTKLKSASHEADQELHYSVHLNDATQRSIDHHSDRDGVSTSGRIVMMAGATGADADKEKRA